MIIAIFEDNPVDAELLSSICYRWSKKYGRNIKVRIFQAAKELEDELSDRSQYPVQGVFLPVFLLYTICPENTPSVSSFSLPLHNL